MKANLGIIKISLLNLIFKKIIRNLKKLLEVKKSSITTRDFLKKLILFEKYS